MASWGPLADLRVVDLTREAGAYCTRTLADIGADVVRIEPVEGDPLRARPPFVDDVPGPDRGILHLHCNANKRSVALDIERDAGRSILERLIGDSDIVVDEFDPEEAARLGLSFEDLRAIKPTIIHASVTPFGLSGPHALWQGSDLIAQATGGVMILNGYPDDRPAQLAFSQAYQQASLYAAVGILAAVVQRDATGEGAHIEVSIQDSIALVTAQVADLNLYTRLGHAPHRAGGEVVRTVSPDGTVGVRSRSLLQVADGWVALWQRVVPYPETEWVKLLGFLEELGCVDDLRDPAYLAGAYQTERAEHIRGILNSCLSSHTREEVYHAAQKYSLVCMPVREVHELFEDEQLRGRGYFVDLPHPDAGRTLTYAGAPYIASDTEWKLDVPAPRLGQHTEAVLRELGVAADLIADLVQDGVIAGATEAHA